MGFGALLGTFLDEAEPLSLAANLYGGEVAQVDLGRAEHADSHLVALVLVALVVLGDVLFAVAGRRLRQQVVDLVGVVFEIRGVDQWRGGGGELGVVEDALQYLGHQPVHIAPGNGVGFARPRDAVREDQVGVAIEEAVDHVPADLVKHLWDWGGEREGQIDSGTVRRGSDEGDYVHFDGEYSAKYSHSSYYNVQCRW